MMVHWIYKQNKFLCLEFCHQFLGILNFKK
jgi:hypothetical protein